MISAGTAEDFPGLSQRWSWHFGDGAEQPAGTYNYPDPGIYLFGNGEKLVVNKKTTRYLNRRIKRLRRQAIKMQARRTAEWIDGEILKGFTDFVSRYLSEEKSCK
jgi:hypothetical protein